MWPVAAASLSMSAVVIWMALRGEVAVGRTLVFAGVFGGGVGDVRRADADVVGFEALLGKKGEDGGLILVGFAGDGGEVVAGLFVADRPTGVVCLDGALDEALDRDVAVGEAGFLDLVAERPAAEDEAKKQAGGEDECGLEVVAVGHTSASVARSRSL